MSDVNKQYQPSIICELISPNGNEVKRQITLTYNGLKMLISLSVGPIQFKHLQFEDFLKTMEHYIKVCEENPPKRLDN